jgi:hypothetical protein
MPTKPGKYGASVTKAVRKPTTRIIKPKRKKTVSGLARNAAASNRSRRAKRGR